MVRWCRALRLARKPLFQAGDQSWAQVSQPSWASLKLQLVFTLVLPSSEQLSSPPPSSPTLSSGAFPGLAIHQAHVYLHVLLDLSSHEKDKVIPRRPLLGYTQSFLCPK